ncbi:MAG TPA: hypothetical protein VGD10_11960 [Allosphingosinicella sp.]|uniref:hypothetical protein n=1 Tax=Allosphingosinicella sp. TaxID=2823234 RepID=UPI002ED8B180
MFRALAPTLLAALLVGGCTQQGSFPSLRPRAVERLTTDEPVRPVPVVAADAGLEGQVSGLLADARRGQAEFESLLGPTRAVVGRAGSAGTDSWVEAQQALSRLEAARALTVTALAELDRLSLERAGQPTNSAQYGGLVEAVESAAGLAEAQQAEIDRLRRAISG